MVTMRVTIDPVAVAKREAELEPDRLPEGGSPEDNGGGAGTARTLLRAWHDNVKKRHVRGFGGGVA
jgi:hypothetical protein